jgi:uncharacterized membrane protein
VASSIIARISASLALLACAVWLGGMIALGAVTAPVVFGMVPAPMSGDAMTTIFGRFDKVALACAGVVMFTEVVRGAAFELLHARAFAKLDLARIAAAICATALLACEAFSIAPKITQLHSAGVVRGDGDLGMELDRVHRLAESVARIELVFVAIVIVLHVVTVARPIVKRAEDAPTRARAA